MTRYASPLPEPALTSAFEHTFHEWAEGRSRAEHEAFQREQLARGGAAGALGYVGLLDGSGALLASMKRYRLVLRAGDAYVPALGIGALCVPEARRGRGLARALVRAALDEAEALGETHAVLFSEIDPRAYEGMGFSAHPRLVVEAVIAALPPSREPLVELSPSEPGSLALLSELDRERAVDELEVRVAWGGPHAAYLAWRNHGRLFTTPGRDAVVVAASSGRTLSVLEVIAPGSSVARAVGLVAGVAERCGAASVRLVGCADELAPALPVGTPWASVPMIAALGGRPPPRRYAATGLAYF